MVIVADMGSLKTSSRQDEGVGRDVSFFVEILSMRSLRVIRGSVHRLEL